MEEIYLQRLAQRAKQDDTLLDKLSEEVRVEVEKYLKKLLNFNFKKINEDEDTTE